jgi:hypothetical protein
LPSFECGPEKEDKFAHDQPSLSSENQPCRNRVDIVVRTSEGRRSERKEEENQAVGLPVVL